MPPNFVFENKEYTCLRWEECKGAKRAYVGDSTKDITTEKNAIIEGLALKNTGDESGKCLLGAWDWKSSKYLNELKTVTIAPGKYYPKSELVPINIGKAGTDIEISLMASWRKNGEYEQQDSLGTFLLHKITAAEPCYHIRTALMGYPYFEWDSEKQEIEKLQKEIPINATLYLKNCRAFNYGAKGTCKLVVNDFGGKGYIFEKEGALETRAGWISTQEIGKLSDLGYAAEDELTLQILCMSFCDDSAWSVRVYGNYYLKVVAANANMVWLDKDNWCLRPHPANSEETVYIRQWLNELCTGYIEVKNVGGRADTPHFKLLVGGEKLLDQDDPNGNLAAGSKRTVNMSFTAPDTGGDYDVILKVWGKTDGSEPT